MESWTEKEYQAALEVLRLSAQSLNAQDFEGAEHGYRQVRAIIDMMATKEKKSRELELQAINELGFCRQQLGDSAEAEILHREAVEVVDVMLEDGLEGLEARAAATYINYSSFLAAKNDLAAARKLARRAAELAKEALQADPKDSVRQIAFGALENLAIVETRNGDAGLGAKAMLEAMELVEELDPMPPALLPQVSRACQQLSVLFFNEKNFEDALFWGRKAETWSEKAFDVLGPNALPIYITSQINLISYYEKEGSFAEAEDALWKAIEVAGNHQDLLRRGKAFYETCRKQADTRLQAGNLPREEVEEGYDEIKTRINSIGGLPERKA